MLNSSCIREAMYYNYVMHNQDQSKTPLFTAIKDYIESKPIPFDVPGHKMGSLKTDLSEYIGELVYRFDINAPIGLDNLYHPHGVIKESEDLMASLFHADEAIFSVNGTTGGIMTMIVGTCDAKDKIILPRNVHKSVINALILSGAVPIFVMPDIDQETGIANGVKVEEYTRAMDENPDAKAIFVINPTYFGVTSDLEKIVMEAHKRDILVLVDEAHGSHLYFHDDLPLGGMEAGADISALSLHKTFGSLTQSSIILVNKKRVNFSRIQRVFAMFSSTSPNHLLLASMDVARKNMALKGRELLDKTLTLARQTRSRINEIPGFHCMDKSYCDAKGRFNFDETKLVINTSELGLSGFDIFKEIRKLQNVQLELGEVSEILAVFTIGTTPSDADNLVEGLTKISEKYYEITDIQKVPHFSYAFPELIARPREAFHAPSKIIPLEDALGEISAESLMVYPPGIPIAIPGEVITRNAIDLLEFYEKAGGVVLSDSPDGYVKVIDQENWFLGSELDYDF